MTKENSVSTSSGNVFADLGLPNPEERLVKAELARKIRDFGVGLQPLRTSLRDAARTVSSVGKNQNSLQHSCLLPSAFLAK